MDLSLIAKGSEFPHIKANSALIRDQGLKAVVDCGGKSETGVIQQELAKNGISSSKVELLLLTHLHYDHCENIDLFDKATVIVNWKEIEFFERLLGGTTEEDIKVLITKHYEHVQNFYLRAICQRLLSNRERYRKFFEDNGRLQVIEDDYTVTNRIMMVETSGHSAGHMSIQVLSDRPVWIAGDAIISLSGWNQPSRGIQQICWNSHKHLASCEKIAASGGIVIPGHGEPFDLNSLSAGLCKDFVQDIGICQRG